jgi:hypothetical protein
MEKFRGKLALQRVVRMGPNVGIPSEICEIQTLLNLYSDWFQIHGQLHRSGISGPILAHHLDVAPRFC